MMALTMEQPIIAGNPQASLCDLSWLGGIIDGEGCLTLDKRGGKARKQQCVAPVATIVNTDEVLTDKVQEILRKNGVAFHVRVHPQKGEWRRKIEIVVSGIKRVTRFLDLVRPYLVSKAAKADLIRSFCESRLQSFGEYSDDEKELCRKVWSLNGRGTKHW